MLRLRARRRAVRKTFCLLVLGLAMLSAAVSSRATLRAQTAATPDPSAVGQPIRIDVQPATVQLAARRAAANLLVTGHYADGTLRDLTRAADFVSLDQSVAETSGHRIVPVGNGTGDIKVRVGSCVESVTVTVAELGQPNPVSFRNETLAALTAKGCNSGGCHGSPSGKAGFRLSLEAFDPEFDSLTLIHESYGRRTNLIEPAASLLLLKPLMRVSHGGGQRLRRTDPAYQVLRTWIAEGCHVDTETASPCVRLEVLPEPRLLKLPDHSQQLVARAHYADGTVRDVTHLAKFKSSDDTVATVGSGGLVVGHDRGETAIMVRYLQHLESTLITVVRDVEGFVWEEPSAQQSGQQYVDVLVNRKLRTLRFRPSALCTDSEFLRRVYLDVTGGLPPVENVIPFLDDPSADKRVRLIEQLLDQPEYANFWALHWGDLLRLNNESIAEAGVHKFYQWIVDALERNMPFDEFARALLTAHGSTLANPPANYYRALKDATVSTESTAQVFLGVRIECAKCHNHPFESWTQDNYYGLSAFFHRVRKREGTRPGEQVIWMAREGDVTQPRTGQVMPLWLPQQGTVTNSDDRDPRELFADWLTDPENPFFARVAVNRIWAHVMGRGIVHPVDDFRASNPPANAELLDALANDFRESGFDQKHILRTILNSRTYQRSARTNQFNSDDAKYFSRAQVRMLTAEQMLDAICHVTDIAEHFSGLPNGTRAAQLPSPDQANDFLKTFGQPDRVTACACERSTSSNLSQALQLFNSDVIHAKLKAAGNRIHRAIEQRVSNDALITELYLAALSRRPDPAELAATRTYVEEHDDRGAGFEDLAWSLMNSKEFLFQH